MMPGGAEEEEEEDQALAKERKLRLPEEIEKSG